MYVNLGGRVILLNPVFNVIPIFFPKMHVNVWKSLVRIQKIFLWSSVKGDAKIFWARWSNVCKSKMNESLGVRDLCLVNLALLANWRGRLLMGVSG